MRTSCIAALVLCIPLATTAQAPAADPLQEALRSIGANPGDLVTPKALERDYNLACRLPLIDRLMAEPLSLPTFWQDFADELAATRGSSSAAYRLALATLNDGVHAQAPLAAGEATTDRRSVERRLQELFPSLGRERIEAAWGAEFLPRAHYRLIGRLAELLHAVDADRRAAFAGADLEALELLQAHELGYFFEDGEYSFLTVGVERMAELQAIADELRRVDFAALFRGGGRLLDEAETSLASRAELGHGPAVEGPLFALDTPAGRLVVGGHGDDDWTEPAAILVDLGGNDRYGEGLGAARATPAGFAFLLDLAGDDSYESAAAPAQGNGTLGLAVLVDAAGDDRYRAGSQAQGSAFGGVGVLVDEEGDDSYEGGFLVQGASAFGLGLLLDRDGNDRFVSDGFAQGYGGALAMGLLHDSAGDDVRECGSWNDGPRQLRLGNCQGGAVGVRSYPWTRDPSHYGGLGFLVDDGGNDRYDAKIHSQGGSYFLGLGALFDREGDDRYAGHREHHQGGSMHLAAAILTDLEGDDRYYGYDSSQGAGNDRSVGILLDHEGDDLYESPFGNSQAYSRKANSVSLLVDAEGDDRYRCREEAGDERCQGYAQLTSTPHDQSVVVFLDLEGDDSYDEPGRQDGETWAEQPGVIGADLPRAPAPVFASFQPRSAVAGSDPFAQFRAVAEEPPPRRPARFAAWLDRRAAAAGRSGGTEWHYDLEQVTLMAARGELSERHYRALSRWLAHPSAGHRAQTAKLLGRSDAPVARALRAALRREPRAEVRGFLIEALGRLGDAAAAPLLARAVAADPSADCRRLALAALQAVDAGGEGSRVGLLLEALGDEAADMRFVAAKSLAAVGDPSHADRLAGLGQDGSPWVRRAAAHALMASGDERGIPMMFETMDFYSLDNSYYNWGRDIGKLLEKYTNVSFKKIGEDGRERRDDLNRDRWRAWWSEHGESFRLEDILPAARLIDEGDRLRAAKQEEQARARYEQALRLVPGHSLAQERLAAD